MSQLGTSDYPPTSTTTSDFTPITPTVSPSLAIPHIGHLQSPPQFPHHFQVHTWAPPITHSISPPLPISHSGTSDYPPTFPTTPNFMSASDHPSPLYRSLPISYLGTSHYPPNSTTTPNFTLGHIQLPTHFPHHSQFHTWAPLIPPHFTNHFQYPT